jgi:hypothetical protein
MLGGTQDAGSRAGRGGGDLLGCTYIVRLVFRPV